MIDPLFTGFKLIYLYFNNLFPPFIRSFIVLLVAMSLIGLLIRIIRR